MNKSKTEIQTSNVKWDSKTEVLVIGTGFAGLSAAIEAKTHGADVLIIEKMKSYGGNSIISDGGIAAPNTKLQKKYGIEDSTEVMYNDMIKAGLGLNRQDLLRRVVYHAKEAFEWTRDELGVPYMDRVDIFGGHSIPRCYTPKKRTGATIIKKMMQKANELDIPIQYQVAFSKFLMDEKGNIEGVVVKENYDYKTNYGDEKRIYVTKGVILATGGFGADISFRQIQNPRLDKSIDTTNKPFATAEGLKEAIRIGVATLQLSQIQIVAWTSPDEKGLGKGPLFADYILFQYGIMINTKTGKRFVNELGDRKVTADATLTLGEPCIGIADQTSVEQSGWDISATIKKGVIKVFDCLKDIATNYHVDFDELQQTITKYNSYISTGEDKDFGKLIVDDAKPIDTPPYYVMRLWPKVHFTMGGIYINEKAEALNYDNQIIPRLYAAGEVVGGVHGASRLGSTAITECIVFGRIAGSEAAMN